MALRTQASFAAGELDPALHDRTTLEKYDAGLKTARNNVVGKTGRLISRAGRKNFAKTKNNNEQVVLYYPPNSGYYTEWGPGYVRVMVVDGVPNGLGTGDSSGINNYLEEYVTDYVAADIPKLRFDFNRQYVYIFCIGKAPKKMFLGPGGGFATTFYDDSNTPLLPIPNTTGTNGGTGYAVQYQVSLVWNGQESLPVNAAASTSFQIPISNGQINSFTVRARTGYTLAQAIAAGLEKMNVYRRPVGGAAFGYIGSTNDFQYSGGNVVATFNDVGGSADYSHTPVAPVINLSVRGSTGGDDPSILLSATGTFYQQRLLIVDTLGGGQGIIASRTGFPGDFRRDFPYSSSSALQFKAGSSGGARVLHMIDSDGLIVFTTLGVYINVGVLGPDNIALEKKGSWVADENIPPLAVPGGVIFVDTSTNSIRVLEWSTENATYNAPELSAYSAHLFTGKRVTSMAFQTGDLPCLWVTFNDGTFASLTYEKEQEMRAWTPHNSDPNILIEQVVSTNLPNKTIFLTNRSGIRYTEMTVPRYVSGVALTADSEANMGEATVAMDSFVTFKTILNDSLLAGQSFSISPVTAGVWDGPLTLTCGTSGVFTAAGNGAVGKRFRYFDSDLTSYDLVVTARASDNSVTVMPNHLWPSTIATGFRLYLTFNQVSTNLSHLELEYPGVVVDGGVTASPNNDIDTGAAYAALRVISGTVTLPAGMYAAIMHVGRAITYDVETLDVATVEQRPTFLESKTVDKVYVRVLKTRGLYVSNTFPANNKVAGMLDMDETQVHYNQDIAGPVMGNTFEKPYSRRITMTIPGDWNSQGRVCIRQVDPVHYEILSIIPDLEDLRR